MTDETWLKIAKRGRTKPKYKTNVKQHLIQWEIKVSVDSQLHAIFGSLVQSHSPLCSFTCRTESDVHLRL